VVSVFELHKNNLGEVNLFLSLQIKALGKKMKLICTITANFSEGKMTIRFEFYAQ